MINLVSNKDLTNNLHRNQTVQIKRKQAKITGLFEGNPDSNNGVIKSKMASAAKGEKRIG